MMKSVAILLIVNVTCVFSFVEKLENPPRSRACLQGSLSSPYSQDSSFQPLDLNLLAFPVSDTLFLGQSTCVTLKEGRFFDLVDDATSNHDSLLGMVLMNDDGKFMDGVPLCKIVDIDVRSGFRGKVTISVEFQAIGRARLEKLKQMQPTMIGTCIEFQDKLQTNMKELKKSQRLVDRLAENIKKPSLAALYRRTYTDARAILEDEYLGTESQDLAAKSWAFMACLTEESIAKYGPEAIASNDIHQRLDIIAKAFLEEQIRSTESMMLFHKDDQEISGFE